MVDREKLWNIELVVDEIREFPQTYKTILGELKDDGTCQKVLRRKLGNLCRVGTVCKMSIPGTRFGKVLFYSLPKDYNILVEGGRLGSSVFCFFDYKKINNFKIRVDKSWELSDGVWKSVGARDFSNGDILRFL